MSAGPAPGATPSGVVNRVDGPVVQARRLADVAMFDLVHVGPSQLPGEVIGLDGDVATIQVYEYTGGLQPGAAVAASGGPLAAALAPGLLGGIFDGLLRPLDPAQPFLDGTGRAEAAHGRFPFEPAVEAGAVVQPGAVLGTLRERGGFPYRVLVPHGLAGRVEWVAEAAELGVDEHLAIVEQQVVTPLSQWPVRRPRPHAGRLAATRQLVTGQRVVDLLFPVASGGTVSVPGGFGTGKTVLLQQIAKWCDAEVIVYVGCGERGNELADVLAELAELDDPRRGGRLLDRTVLIANTSNMPVLAREASIHTGLTVAEHYRDMGHDAVVIADSTSRWAEALREVASRTDALPAEEGFPASLPSALAGFYERAGRVRTLSGAEASVTIIGAVSPPGGDVSEPVTAHTRRFVRTLWSLDRDLAYARHYPAVSWRDSWSRDADVVAGETSPLRLRAMTLLTEADRLASVAELVGAAVLPETERLVLRSARLLREGVLRQSALSANDGASSLRKAVALLGLVLDVHDACAELLAAGTPLADLEAVDLSPLARAAESVGPDDAAGVEALRAPLLARLREATP